MATGGDARVVAGKWRMGETLGKGGYSWVKKGTNINNEEETVALKFTNRDRSKWTRADQETIDTEVKALTQLTKEDHPNIMKIFEYNMNCKYPDKNGGPDLDTILFVLELATGGELFDILFYTGKLSEEEGRTYFAQLVDGLEHLHQNGICHRDIKPQNLLLSGDFTLKITDFGLSKVMESESDTTMRTKVGTRGYQAPEQLTNQPYTTSADIFAAGVVLFVLMAGYPPFEHARKNDPWYKQLIPKPGKEPNYTKFWRAHRAAGLSPEAQDFINNLLAYDPHKRFSIEQIREHGWFNGKKLSGDELNASLSRRVAEVHRGRLNDAEKVAEQNYSIKRRGVKKYDEARVAPAYATATQRSMFDFRTKAHPDALLETIQEFVTSCKGHTDVDSEGYKLKGLIQTEIQEMEFQASVYSDKASGENVLTLKRMAGGFVEYGKIYKMLLEKSLYPLKALVEAEEES